MSTNVSSVVSHFPDAENGFTSTTAGSVASGAVTVTLNSIAGYTNGEPVVLVIDPTDAAKKQTFTGIVDTAGVQVTSVVWTAGTNQTHALGATVVDYATATHIAMISKGIQVEHAQAGTHKAALITSRTEDTSPDVGADFLLSYDTSATALKKVKPSNLGLTTGWLSGQLPAVSSVTNNGNRSVDTVFASTVASILTPGMRVRGSRTVAAPTQCTDLESGSSQYYSKTSPAGMTFTDDFVVSAWVKLESYTNGIIASRYNGTSGWYLNCTATGQILLNGINAGSGNFSYVQSYQSIPLNKWVHIAAQLDMSTFTATTTTSYVMIDGEDVPATLTRAGTNPTALIQAGNLEIGAMNGGTVPFDGKLAQVVIYSGKISQTNIRNRMNQTADPGGSASMISAYSFNGVITDLNTTNANDLTANGAAVATNADSPFGLDSNGVPSGTYEWGIVTKVSTTTASIQFPEGSCFPTAGGVSTVDYSGVKAPFGMPVDSTKWAITNYYKADFTQTSPVSGTWYNLTTTSGTAGGMKINLPIGRWKRGYDVPAIAINGTNQPNAYATLSTAAATESDNSMTSFIGVGIQIASANIQAKLTREDRAAIDITAATDYYLNAKTVTASATTLALRGSTDFAGTLYADLAYL